MTRQRYDIITGLPRHLTDEELERRRYKRESLALAIGVLWFVIALLTVTFALGLLVKLGYLHPLGVA